jgi:hypothetical protein
MEVDSLVITTTEELNDLAAQLGDYNGELVIISVHMVKKIRDGWISGCNHTRMNEGGRSTFKSLIGEKDVNCFHMEV